MSGLFDADGKVDRAYRPDFSECVMGYCKWYQDDFLGGIRGMTAATIGIYSVLLNEMYAQGRVVNLPAPQLARLCGTTVPTLRHTLKLLEDAAKIIVLDAGLWNARVEQTFTHRKKTRGVQSNAGLQSAQKRNEIKGTDQQTFNGRSTSVQPVLESQKVREEDDDNDAGASQRIATFRDQILDAIGVDYSGLTGRGGTRIGTGADMAEAVRWSGDLNLTEPEQLAVIREVMARRTRGGPPSTFTYFTKAMQELAAVKAAPPLETPKITRTPVGELQDARPSQTREGRYSAERLNRIIGAAIGD